MTTEQMVGLVIAVVVMFIGLAGCVLPGLPGTPLILLGAIGHKIYFGEQGPGWVVLVALAGLTALSIAVDYLATMVGAKKMGATWRGAFGAIVGALVGLFFSLPGLLLGPFLGAVAFEMAGGRQVNQAGRAGVGAVLGLLAGAVGKVAAGLAMIALFIFSVVLRS